MLKIFETWWPSPCQRPSGAALLGEASAAFFCFRYSVPEPERIARGGLWEGGGHLRCHQGAPEGEMRLLIEAIRQHGPGGRSWMWRWGRAALRGHSWMWGSAVVGVDISGRMMEKAREKGVTELIFADVHGTPFKDGSFDAALIVHLLHLVRTGPRW